MAAETMRQVHRQGRRQSAGGRRKQDGMTLIEVMVSIVLVAIGLVGLLGLLATSMQNSEDAQDRNRAAVLANELTSAMWIYGSTNVSAGPLAAYYATWQATASDPTNGKGLYQGNANAVPNNATGPVTITITWSSPHKQQPLASNTYNTYGNVATTPSTYTTQVVLP